MGQGRENRGTRDSAWGNTTVQLQKEQSKITISDVADALGVSKTTVSRAISGKGRISEDTRQRVLEYIKENHYRPNVVAKGLAESKTYNIGWVMPGDPSVIELPFFQRCMLGISRIAAEEDYDILISMVFDHDFSQLKRIVKNHKVDGVILGRALMKDERIDFLVEHEMPFVVIGSSLDDRTIQIDNDHISACKELTSIIIMKGAKTLGLIGGNTNYAVNRLRRKGFEQACGEQGLEVNQDMVYMNCDTENAVEHAVDNCLLGRAECIICMDDRICHSVLNKLHREGISIPGQIKVASFYNSTILKEHQPAITSLQFDPKELGEVASRTLFDYIDGKEVLKKVTLDYEVILTGSTQ